MRRVILLSTLLLAVSMSGRAFDGPGCGGEWRAGASYTATRNCSFAFNGFPLTVRGDSITTSGATVRATITLGNNQEVAVLECSDTGSTYATCENDVSNDNLPRSAMGLGVALGCHVEGKTGGQYYCASGHQG